MIRLRTNKKTRAGVCKKGNAGLPNFNIKGDIITTPPFCKRMVQSLNIYPCYPRQYQLLLLISLHYYLICFVIIRFMVGR